ncbi:hypothetical protein R5R35_004569 [Gryllus longicercus]|uniref:Uncharacterized protein n=1 Tax=Gryllus longicercus TaxID=2509291 RepID=A0AAN9ZDD5_9ORTH
MEMDPWLTNGNECQSVKTSKFEDDFVPCEKLPDSEEYLATLERKLAKLKERQSKKDLVESLEETRKSCMLRLVTEGIAGVQEDLDLDIPVNNSHASSTLLRHIAPERQALTLGELVELLKADQLSEKLAEDNSDIEVSSEDPQK